MSGDYRIQGLSLPKSHNIMGVRTSTSQLLDSVMLHLGLGATPSPGTDLGWVVSTPWQAHDASHALNVHGTFTPCQHANSDPLT